MATNRVHTYNAGNFLFIPHDDLCYTPVEALEKFDQGQKGKVKFIGPGQSGTKEISKKESQHSERMDGQSMKGIDDMIKLKLLNDAALLHNLRLRYTDPRGINFYTDIGAILVSINPYKDLGLYTPEQEDVYLESGAELVEKAPHVFKVAELAFRALQREGRDQSCVVTGESGAGKTEATKRFLQYIAEKSRRNRESYGNSGPDATLLRQQILDANPFMEAFGNAKTSRNDNSSRFGKLIELYFDAGKGILVGAKIEDYLLEKSRVVKVGKGERNYHIFYQLCAAASNTHPDMKKKYHLLSADQFRYTLGENSKLADLAIPDEVDHEVYEETYAAMKKLGMTEEEIDTIFRIASGILHLGNVTFDGSDQATVKKGLRGTHLAAAAELFGVDQDGLEHAILERDLGKIIKGNRDVKKAHTKQEAEAARDGLAKHLYNNMFEWLIQKMNMPLNEHTTSSGVSNPKFLAVLDIFGFEHFKVNSFEQMCINFCNEKLQAFFNDHVFKREQKVYEEEGIDARNVGFYDNQGVVDCIEKGPKSIMVICDDQCWLESATDKGFLNKILNVAKKPTERDAYLQAPRIQDIRKNPHLKNAFKIIHYAGDIHYNVENFLEKNKDQLRADIISIISSSSIPMLQTLFPQVDGKGAKYRKTLGTKFKDSLNRLMKRLNSTTPQFIRTIKPNENKRPGEFNSINILRQLREAGLLEVCKIRKMGYPVRQTHHQFYTNYLCLDKSAKDVPDLCKRLADKGILHSSTIQQFTSNNWQIGKTMVFMRAEQADELEQKRGEALAGVLRIIHRAARSFLFRNRLHRAVLARRGIREAIANRDPEKLREHLEFFLEKGAESLPIVQEGMRMMKELQKQLDVLGDLEKATERKDVSSMKVGIDLATDMGLGDHEIVAKAKEVLDKLETERLVKNRLQSAIGEQDINQLRSALDLAEEKGLSDLKEARMAKNLMKTLQEREKLLGELRDELAKGDDADVKKIEELVSQLRENGISDSDPLILEALQKCEMILEANSKREKRIKTLEKQLKKNIEKKDLKKLKDLVNAAIQMRYTGPLMKQAIEVIQALERRNELINEVVKASRVLRGKSKMPDGIDHNDLIPLQHAIEDAEKDTILDLGNEVQVIDGKKLLEEMEEQIVVQEEIKQALKKDTQAALYAALAKVQRLGLQTKDADTLCQRVREFEALRAIAEARNNRFRRADILENLKTFADEEEREKHLLRRIEQIYAKDFKKRAKECAQNRDLAMSNFYRVRNDADFVEREPRQFKEERANLKLAYIPFRMTKPLLEMDQEQETIALNINRSILSYCEGLGVKNSSESRAMFIVKEGLADPLMADEIFIQLSKHLTANPNPLSKNRGWHLMCMCSTYFGCSEVFEPYLMHFLQNSINDAGLEGNYARYTLAQLSMSMVVKETRYKPSTKELKSFMIRPPVLCQVELLDGNVADVPMPPDLRLTFGLKLLRKMTKIMVAIDKPDWAFYIKATTKPPVLTYKTRLQNFYRKYKPENLPNVDAILKYHEGNEEALFDELVQISNYGPEPVPTLVGPKRKNKKARTSSVDGATETLFEDDADSQYSTSSKSSIGSRALSVISGSAKKVLQKARGKTGYNFSDFDPPTPTIAWPMPQWAFIGDIMNALFQQDKVPIISYKRRMLKIRGRPDENMYLQLQREFLEGTLVPYTESENAKFSVIILAVRLMKLGKNVPYGDADLLLQAGLDKCIPKSLRKENKKNKEYIESYAKLAAEKSNDLPDFKDVKKLQRLFFEECVKAPTFGMSFFFAHVLKGNVQSFFAKTSEDESDAIKIGINQKEVAFFQGGIKYEAFALSDIVKYWEDGSTFNLKVKRSKSSASHQRDRELVDVSMSSATVPTKKKGKLFGGKTETISLYTLQLREMYDLLFFMKNPK
mmetsp:Transcript_2821/g.3225  ORF Transcript_2821/g.3225 Transcript_2821/m.3225 type:complete len:1899 (+) Transcript_2821:218-5914(+)|eukprot:CAMPEP_0184047090 /NCGR_PEP_ID=MMETSP0956-20121227/1963_1 /TAXON_ID=627963 /ORGANISM="Aplanochytrium sp, Strain PBS07" /LENGTH=1898 /DNA_ID=CAMNT_0026338835 /DNA_START=248 /DNA_END=5944 /DNA_ORIENTATION=+